MNFDETKQSFLDSAGFLIRALSQSLGLLMRDYGAELRRPARLSVVLYKPSGTEVFNVSVLSDTVELPLSLDYVPAITALDAIKWLRVYYGVYSPPGLIYAYAATADQLKACVAVNAITDLINSMPPQIRVSVAASDHSGFMLIEHQEFPGLRIELILPLPTILS